MRRGVEIMPKSKGTKNGAQRVLQIEIILDTWNILITDSGDTVTNADGLLTKSARLRHSKVLFD